VARLAIFPTPVVSDCLGRLSGVVGLRPFHKRGPLAGPAFTVKTRPGDNLMIHKALDLAAPGDVLVIDGGGELANALVGELMQLYAIQRGLAGFVVDGAIRDLGAYAASDFPCFARGSVHRGPYKDGPGEINVPVNIGGLVIEPGDVVLGDEDGVVAISPDRLEELIEACRRKAEQEAADKLAINSGCYDRTWISEALSRRGLV
jgi:RraA family protein